MLLGAAKVKACLHCRSRGMGHHGGRAGGGDGGVDVLLNVEAVGHHAVDAVDAAAARAAVSARPGRVP